MHRPTLGHVNSYEASMWRKNLQLQVNGHVQIAPVTGARDIWGLYSVNASGMKSGDAVSLTATLEKKLVIAKAKKKRKAAQTSGRSTKKPVVAKAAAVEEDCEQSQDDSEVSGGGSALLLKIVDVSEPLKSKLVLLGVLAQRPAFDFIKRNRKA